MMLARHARGHVAVGQPAHAWLSGQLARAWGNERFGAVEPREEVCLAAEQHDIGMAEWDLAPTLDRDSGLPTTFLAMDLQTHLRLWSAGPRKLLTQSRYAALLASLHGSALYGGQRGERGDAAARDREQIRDFLDAGRAFQARLRATLDADERELSRNQRLLWTWDGLSLALILQWAPWTAAGVPAAQEPALDLRLGGAGGRHTLAPWPFAVERVTVRTEGRLLEQRQPDEASLHEALARAPWVQLAYELRPG
jgi:Protein of unknown function (DUF3891)